MSVRNLAQFGVTAVQHQDPEVRQAGQDLVLLLYKVDQEAVRKEMPEDNNRNRYKEYSAFEIGRSWALIIFRRSHANRYVFEQMDEYDKRHGYKR